MYRLVCCAATSLQPSAAMRYQRSVLLRKCCLGLGRLYVERQHVNERLFELLQPPPPDNPEYQDQLQEVTP